MKLADNQYVSRFARISRGQDQVAIHDLEGVSELHSNPFIHRAFALFDTDNDGMLSLQDFTKAIDVLGHLNNSEQQLKCEWQCRRCLTCP